MNKNFKYLLILTTLVSCSSKKETGMISLDNVDQTPIENVASDSKVINLESSGLLKKEDLEISANSMFDDSEKYASASPIVMSDANSEVSEDISDDDTYNDTEDIEDTENKDFGNIVESNEIDKTIPNTVEYIIRKNETLMLIAHKLYGDYRKWKEIKNVNGDLLAELDLKTGTKILVPTPEETFQAERNGTPYLIKSGDTLGTVSVHAYQTPKHWKYVWENNKSSIRDPNLIFAGFTVYYIPLTENSPRELASEAEL